MESEAQMTTQDPGQLLRQQVWGRAFLKVGRKHRDPLLLRAGQELLAAEGNAMSDLPDGDGAYYSIDGYPLTR
jgi:hypothetical protein